MRHFTRDLGALYEALREFYVSDTRRSAYIVRHLVHRLPPQNTVRASTRTASVETISIMNNGEERFYGQTHFSPHGSSEHQVSNRPASDSVQDAYRLMAMYPLASATPITHGKCKLSFV